MPDRIKEEENAKKLDETRRIAEQLGVAYKNIESVLGEIGKELEGGKRAWDYISQKQMDVLTNLAGQEKRIRSQAELTALLLALKSRIKQTVGDEQKAYEATIRIGEVLTRQSGLLLKDHTEFVKSIAGATGEVKKGLPFWMRWRQSLTEMAEGTHRLTRANKVYVDDSGKVVTVQRTSAKIMQSISQGLMDSIRMALRGLTIWGAIAVALYEILDRTIKWSGELRRTYVQTGLIEEAQKMQLSYLSDSAKIWGDISVAMGVSAARVREFLQDIRDAGILTAELVKNLDAAFDTSAALKGISEIYGISIGDAASIIERLHISYQILGKDSRDILNISDRQVDRATALYSAMIDIASQYGAFGVKVSDTVSAFGSLLSLADAYNMNIAQVIGLYRGLLAMKFEDQTRSKALRELSLETLKSFAEMTIKAQDMSLSWKVMVATLAGERFENIIDLEKRFMDVSEAAKMIMEAAKAPFRIFFRGELGEEFSRFYKEDRENAIAMIRLIYNLNKSIYEQLDVSFELLEAIMSGEKTSAEIQKAIEESVKHAQEYMKYAERPLLLGMDIYKELRGVAGVLTEWVGRVIRLLIRIAEAVEKLAGIKRPEITPEIVGAQVGQIIEPIEEITQKILTMTKTVEQGERAILKEGMTMANMLTAMEATQKELDDLFKSLGKMTEEGVRVSEETLEYIGQKVRDTFQKMAEAFEKRFGREIDIKFEMTTYTDINALRVQVERALKEAEEKLRTKIKGAPPTEEKTSVWVTKEEREVIGAGEPVRLWRLP